MPSRARLNTTNLSLSRARRGRRGKDVRAIADAEIARGKPGLALLWHLYGHGTVRYQTGIQRSVRCVPICCRVWRRSRVLADAVSGRHGPQHAAALGTDLPARIAGTGWPKERA